MRAGDFAWELQPEGEPQEVFADCPPGTANADVVRMKSLPVATPSYRPPPAITLIQKPMPREHAKKFACCLTLGVITVNEATSEVGVDPERIRAESMSREVLRHPEFEGCVESARLRDHFIFNVETESASGPQRLPPEGTRIMHDKILRYAKPLFNVYYSRRRRSDDSRPFNM